MARRIPQWPDTFPRPLEQLVNGDAGRGDTQPWQRGGVRAPVRSSGDHVLELGRPSTAAVADGGPSAPPRPLEHRRFLSDVLESTAPEVFEEPWLLPPDNCLALERKRLLNVLDSVAPELFKKLVADLIELCGSLPNLDRSSLLGVAVFAMRDLIFTTDGSRVRDDCREVIREWCLRHGLGDTWALEYAIWRLERRMEPYRKDIREDCWPLENPWPLEAAYEPAALAQPAQAPRWIPGELKAELDRRLKDWKCQVEDWKRQQVALRTNWQHFNWQPSVKRDLERLVLWQVLRKSPSAIATLELAGPFQQPAFQGLGNEEKRMRTLKTRTEEIRRLVYRLARKLGLPPRLRGKAGRPRKIPA